MTPAPPPLLRKPSLPLNLNDSFLPLNDPWNAALLLFYKLPGHYLLLRQAHQPHTFTGTPLNYFQLICPSNGTCTVTLRPSEDRNYAMELFQTKTVTLQTRDGLSATVVEKKVIRIKDGRFSLWSVGDGDVVVGEKVADVVMAAVRTPKRTDWSFGSESGAGFVQQVELEAVPWWDERGNANGWGALVFIGTTKTVWRSTHLVKVGGNEEACRDEIGPVEEGRGGGAGGSGGGGGGGV